MQFRWLPRVVLAAVSAAALGCGDDEPHGHEHPPQATPSVADPHDHGAQAVGPHGGYLLDLGEDSLSAELVLDDERHAVTVYLLGSEAVSSAAGEERPDVRIQLFEEGRFVDYPLTPAEPAADVPAFSLADEKLHGAMDAGHVRGRLRVTFGANEYGAPLDDFCHEEHNHDAHDDHEGHDGHDHH